MRVHVVKHVPFEGPGMIAQWAEERGFSLTEQLALTEEFPELAAGDLLVLMGGPMAADDHVGCPWLVAEKASTAHAAAKGVCILGVCLGAQIIADALGGEVRRNPQREIGWFPVAHTAATERDPVFSAFPRGFVVGHWHGDTFTLPDGIEPTLSSEACLNQAFSARDGRVVGLQFHLEWTHEGVADLAKMCADELAGGGAWVQSAEEILAVAPERIAACRPVLFALLDRIVQAGGAR